MKTYLKTLIDQQNRIIHQQDELIQINREILETVKRGSVTPFTISPPLALPTEPSQRTMDIHAAAEYLHRSKRMVQRYVAQGKLSVELCDGRNFFDLEELRQQYINIWGHEPTREGVIPDDTILAATVDR